MNNDPDLVLQTSTVPFFSLSGYDTFSKIVKVYDGDTIHAVFKWSGHFYKWKCRLAHIDTPEMRSKDENEKRKAHEARDKLAELILDKVVHLHCLGFDKYGRLLVEIETSGKKVHQWMIENGHARPYEGGTKNA